MLVKSRNHTRPQRGTRRSSWVTRGSGTPSLEPASLGIACPRRNKGAPDEPLVRAERGVTAEHDRGGQAEANESFAELHQGKTVP